MTLTTHAAVGMVAATWAQDPVVGFFAAMLSHYLLDAIPHGDEYVYWRLVHNSKDPYGLAITLTDITSLLLLSMATLNFKTNVDTGLLWVGIIGGILPDVLMTLQTKIRTNFLNKSGMIAKISTALYTVLVPHDKLHKWFHDLIRTPIRLSVGMGYQIVFIILFFIYFIQ